MEGAYTKCERKDNPVEKANPLSVCTFSYMFPIFKKAYKKNLTEDDLFKPLEEHKSSKIGSELERIWKEENKKHKKTALHRALHRLFGLQFWLIGVLKLFDEVGLVLFLPLGIGRLVAYFERGQTRISEQDAYIAAGVILGTLLVDAFIGHGTMLALQHLAMKMRVACSSLIYRKTLRLSHKALGNTTIGQLVNLLSNDVSKFDQGFALSHFMWIGPIQTAVGIYLLYREIGEAAFFGMVFLLSFIPFQIWLGKRTSVLRLRTALRTDERVRLMNEVLSGIQVIKMYCWEEPFAKLVNLARRKEMKIIRQHSYLLGLIYSLEAFVSRTSIFISLLGYLLLGNYVTAEKAFAITAIYNQLKPTITILFSISISNMAEINISVMRLQKLLCYDERKDYEVENQNFLPDLTVSKNKEHTQNGGIQKPKLIMENVCAKWNAELPEDTLENINLNIVSNQLFAIIGPVGSGKSSLINVILKELAVKSGSMEVVGTISFASQETWLFSGSVRQNILFGNEYDEERYEKVVDVCALHSDFALFPHGDKTLVGEKGKSLSGGQKARINLARCLYKHADIYLLDDPLSAVDANVGKHLYERAIKEFLSDKICILVTHQLQYLVNANKIIIMKDGQIEMQGNYRELQTSGLDFAKMLQEFHTDEEKEKARSRQNSELEEIEEVEEEAPIIEKEAQESGKINTSVYWTYLKSGGGMLAITLLVFLLIGCQLVANGGEYVVSYWVNKEEDFSEKAQNNLTFLNETFTERNTIIYVYSALTIGTILISIIKSLYFMFFFTVASITLHDVIFSKIIKATMKFYNKNPSGRILNRFAKDLGTMDEYIPPVMIDVIEIALFLLGVVVLSSIVDPWLLIPSIVLAVIFYFLRSVYIETSRNVKRIEAITKSPIFSHISASMYGLSTIRAFDAQNLLINEFDDLQDRHSSAWYLFIAGSRCFGFWLDLLCIGFITFAIFFLLEFNKQMYGGDLGLVITQCLGLMGMLQWGMRQWSELENNMTSIERILDYTKVETEPERSALNLPKDWPVQGSIEFKQVCLKYDPSDAYVLKDLNFHIKPKEKIGIVGRTGAGKSSTISALFQLYELEGSILIDDVDTTKVPLDEVRSKISIIPQEPVLFSGTMRKNLDPFEEYSDETLWNALEQVELKDVISELPSGLNSNVTEGGTNFSVGQRQLVCLARALIRNNKILVMDEATANVDPHTDALIQQTIRTKFADCTVLTIAHRLHTVMDSDRILVMNAGQVEEFDHPYVLLKKQEGILYNLVKSTGSNTAKNLLNIAKESYEKSNKNLILKE